MSYEFFMIMHLLGIILFVGNAIVTGWWKSMADRTKDSKIIAYAQRQVTLTDYLFTIVGVAMTYAGGMGMASLGGFAVMDETWMIWGHSLFIASGVIWLVVLVPVQVLQSRLAKLFADGGAIPERYWQLGRVWSVFGVIATVLPMANLYWMVVKA